MYFIYIQMDIYIYIHINIYLYKWIHICKYIHIFWYIFICMYIHIFICIYVCIYTYTYIKICTKKISICTCFYRPLSVLLQGCRGLPRFRAWKEKYEVFFVKLKKKNEQMHLNYIQFFCKTRTPLVCM